MDRTPRVGDEIDLAIHPLTKHHGVRGIGRVTSVSPALVIVATPAGFIHCRKEVPRAPQATRR